MTHEQLHLKDYFPFLGKNQADPLLTTYLPFHNPEMKRPELRRPTILLCPGGGYHMVSGREAESVAVHFLPEGYNVFVLTYSVAPHGYPTQLREVAAALELIYQNADAWRVDTARIAIMGFSAGGHLAAHYSTCFDCEAVREVFPESKPVQSTILCYPVISSVEGQCHAGSFRNLLGHFPLTEAENEFFSCHRQVSSNTPPAFLWHTAADQAVPVANSLLYAQALAEHKIPFALHIYPHGRHGLATVDHETNGELSEATRLAADWLPSLKKWLQVTFA